MPLRTKAILALGSSSLLRLDLSFYDPPIPWSNPLLTSAWLKNKIWMFYVLKLESNDLHLIWLESKITRQCPEIGFYKVLCMILGSLTCSKLDVFGDLFINDYLILVLYLFIYFECTRFEAFIPGKSIFKIWITLCISFTFIY